MNRIDRLFSLLTMMQSQKFSTVDQIANRFEISHRTVYRDIRALTEMGIPLGHKDQQGYFIVEGFFLRPISFTTEEAGALILLRSLAGNFSDASIATNCQSALEKIKTVLKNPQKEKLEYIDSHTRVFATSHDSGELNYLSVIQKSIASKTILKMEYKNRQGESSVREAEPIGLLLYLNYWHMIAWCWKASGYRDFNVSRIQSINETNVPFRKENHLDLNDYLQKAIEKYSSRLT